MLEFTWPWAFLLLPLPLLVNRMMARAPRQDAALYVPFFKVLTRLQSDAENLSTSRLLIMICCVLVWLLVVLAASRPQWLGEPVQLPSTGRDLMLAVDISGSMEAQDMVIGNSEASRIAAVKAVVGDFVQRREGDRLGLILFAAHAYVQAPLTFDRKVVGELLEEADIGIIEESATAIGDAIGLAILHLRSRPENARVLVLLTDGVNNAGEVSPEQGRTTRPRRKHQDLHNRHRRRPGYPTRVFRRAHFQPFGGTRRSGADAHRRVHRRPLFPRARRRRPGADLCRTRPA